MGINKILKQDVEIKFKSGEYFEGSILGYSKKYDYVKFSMKGFNCRFIMNFKQLASIKQNGIEIYNINYIKD